jgi:hypothetical protein
VTFQKGQAPEGNADLRAAKIALAHARNNLVRAQARVDAAQARVDAVLAEAEQEEAGE